MIDWDVARITGATLAPPGPSVTAAEAAEVVAELRAAAAKAEAPVREYTGLTADPGASKVLVVDRPTWIAANIDTFRELAEPMLDKIAEKAGIGPAAQAIGGKVSGVELGVLLAYIAPKVLGQFDPFHNRLLLNAPNIVTAERRLGVDPADFRQWVCLHEETHRVQFGATGWLADHMKSLIGQVGDGGVSADRLVEQLPEIIRIVRGQSTSSLAELLQSPEQKAVVDQITGVMSLLEGHADVVMDGVGPEVIPSVKAIRKKFEQRRAGTGSLDRIVRRLLGLEAKMAQYRDGAKFVRAVVDQVGMHGFNAVWAEPANLPTKAEIHDPLVWIKRVH